MGTNAGESQQTRSVASMYRFSGAPKSAPAWTRLARCNMSEDGDGEGWDVPSTSEGGCSSATLLTMAPSALLLPTAKYCDRHVWHLTKLSDFKASKLQIRVNFEQDLMLARA